MTSTQEKRQGTDRRRQPRGGRRPGDIEGLSPLVMVVGDDAVAVGLAEAVLAKLKFAVTTSGTAADASRLLPDLRPDIVVAASQDAGAIGSGAPSTLSIVEMTPAMRLDPTVLVESIRSSLRSKRASA